jgi:hypothetical protein
MHRRDDVLCIAFIKLVTDAISCVGHLVFRSSVNEYAAPEARTAARNTCLDFHHVLPYCSICTRLSVPSVTHVISCY